MYSVVERHGRRRNFACARCGEGRNGADQRIQASSRGASVPGIRTGELVPPEATVFQLCAAAELAVDVSVFGRLRDVWSNVVVCTVLSVVFLNHLPTDLYLWSR